MYSSLLSEVHQIYRPISFFVENVSEQLNQIPFSVQLKKFRNTKTKNYLSTDSAVHASVAAYFPSTLKQAVMVDNNVPVKQSPTLVRTQSSPKPRSLAEYFSDVSNDNLQSEDLLVPQSSFFLPKSELPETECSVQNSPGSGHSIRNVANSSTDVFTSNPPYSYTSTTICPVESNVPVFSSKFAVPSPSFDEQQTTEVLANSRIELDETLRKTPTAATEKILQLTQQLNGILQTSEHLTTSLTSSTGGLSSYSADAELSGICSVGGSEIYAQPCSTTLPDHPMTLSGTTHFKLPATLSNHTSGYVRELEVITHNLHFPFGFALCQTKVG
ncbi:hypothetical protein P879_09801 [Paragonimus westermani]|uniref:Uncharacterized protein n=1 Tax=Paragonimus westermani TaxID=34504 RepID=A0A8T0D780_9TREM|nr:hypothetical protein P879_09801 [Paragonimus westermani]